MEKKKKNRCQNKDDRKLRITKDFKAAMIKMFQLAITNTHEKE